jgi:hypothetical protein
MRDPRIYLILTYDCRLIAEENVPELSLLVKACQISGSEVYQVHGHWPVDIRSAVLLLADVVTVGYLLAGELYINGTPHTTSNTIAASNVLAPYHMRLARFDIDQRPFDTVSIFDHTLELEPKDGVKESFCLNPWLEP